MSADHQKSLQKLKDEITCPVCQDFFQDPKILPCFHYYCKRCVLQLATREQPFPCPECRGDTLLPPTGADGFPTAFFVNRMKSLHDGMEKVVQGATSSGDLDLICEQCCQSADKAIAFCRHCAQYICDYCKESHLRLKVFSGHTVVSIEELRRNAEENLPIVQPSEPMRCKEHQEQLKIYCFTCNQLICRDCTVIDHNLKDHNIQFTSKCAPQIKQALQEKLGPLQNTQAHIQDARKQLERSGNEITAQGTHLEKVINGSFDKMIKVLEQRRCELLTTVHGRVKEKLSSLSSQEKGLEVCTAQIQSLVDFVGQNIGNASDEEIVSIHKQLQCKIEEEMKSCNSLDLTPSASANIGVDISCAAEISQLCQKKTSVITLSHRKEQEKAGKIWEIDRRSMKVLTKLGTGQFGEVWEGTMQVAVKSFKPGTMSVDELLQNLDIMKKLHHPNLIQLYAVCTKEEPFLRITELMVSGCLIDYLRGDGRSLKLPQLIDMSAQVAAGMAYLEEQNYIHRNLTAQNILVGEHLVCKISTFSISPVDENGIYALPWAAPETFKHKYLTIKSNVWSFGIVLWVIIVHRYNPYPGMTNPQVMEAVQQGYRMPCPKSCPEKLYNIMMDTWHKEPGNRPDFKTLKRHLDSFFTS